jgi:AcrR family transcriptional regulator
VRGSHRGLAAGQLVYANVRLADALARERTEVIIRFKKKKRKPGSRAGMTREKIALAAATQIEKLGEEAFSMRQLARTLGVAPTTISSHFKGGLAEIEDEVVKVILADVAPPFRPLQTPTEYLEGMFASALSVLHGRPTVSMLTILRLTHNLLLVSNIAERSLTSLAAMGVAPTQLGPAYREILQTLFGLILDGPGRAYLLPKSEKFRETFDFSKLSESEYPQLFAFQDAIFADLEGARSWRPDREAVKAAVHRLAESLARRKSVAPAQSGGLAANRPLTNSY